MNQKTLEMTARAKTLDRFSVKEQTFVRFSLGAAAHVRPRWSLMRARKQVRKLLSSIWVVGIFAAAAMWAQNPRTPAVTYDEAASAQHADTKPYNIRIQDALTITVWKEPELSGTVVVRPDGKITVPLINELSVVGLTPSQLQTLLMAAIP